MLLTRLHRICIVNMVSDEFEVYFSCFLCMFVQFYSNVIRFIFIHFLKEGKKIIRKWDAMRCELNDDENFLHVIWKKRGLCRPSNKFHDDQPMECVCECVCVLGLWCFDSIYMISGRALAAADFDMLWKSILCMASGQLGVCVCVLLKKWAVGIWCVHFDLWDESMNSLADGQCTLNLKTLVNQHWFDLWTNFSPFFLHSIHMQSSIFDWTTHRITTSFDVIFVSSFFFCSLWGQKKIKIKNSCNS